MGAALLNTPEVAASLIRALRAAVPQLPITCKIRLLDADPLLPKTVAFAQAMEAAGACAINIHMRTKDDKPSEPARWAVLRPLVQALTIPVVANGDLYTRQHVEDIRALSGCAGVMLARPALYNPSVFRTLGKEPALPLLPLDDVVRDYLRLCLRYDNHAANSKYVVMEMMVRRRHPDHIKSQLVPIDLPKDKTMQAVSQSKTVEGLAALWGLQRGAAETDTPTVALEGLHGYSDAYFLEATGTKRGAPCEEETPAHKRQKRKPTAVPEDKRYSRPPAV